MRKLLLSLFMLCSLLSQSQVDPLDQYLKRSFWPSLIPYDSIAVSLDSGAAFNAVQTAAQHYFPNGHIDTLEIASQGTPIIYYDGIWNGTDKTVITGYYNNSGSKIEEIEFYQDQQFKDSALVHYTYQGASKTKAFTVKHHYNGNGDIQSLDVLENGASVGSYDFYYYQGRLDSISFTISLTSGLAGYAKYFYDLNNPSKLIKWEVYSDVNNNGEAELIQRSLFKHNALNQIVEVINLTYQNTTPVLSGAVRYSVRKNSTISLPEPVEVNISLYPNPAFNYLQLEYDPQVFETYKITNIAGQKLKSGKLSTHLDISSLPKGTYVISLKGEKGVIITKFEKN